MDIVYLKQLQFRRQYAACIDVRSDCCVFVLYQFYRSDSIAYLQVAHVRHLCSHDLRHSNVCLAVVLQNCCIRIISIHSKPHFGHGCFGLS